MRVFDNELQDSGNIRKLKNTKQGKGEAPSYLWGMFIQQKLNRYVLLHYNNGGYKVVCG